MSAQALPRLTFDQYLELDRAAECRSEFIKGEVVSMSGASIRHGKIAGRTFSLLDQQLGDGPCVAFSNDTRLYAATEDVSFYPDILVTCVPDQFYDDRQDVLLNATLIVEVLSPSTKRYDLGEKFGYYRSIPSFREYLVLWQDRIRAEHHVRLVDGSWNMREYADREAVIELKSIDCKLNLGSLYARVEFDQAESA